MNKTEVRITGYGGQGVVLSGFVVGRACAIEGGNHSTMIQSFGPEARGSSCSTTLVLSEEEILYPYIRRPDVLVAMSSEGYNKYRNELKEEGILIYEKDLVKPQLQEGRKAFGIPSTRIAEDLGRSMIQNIVMVGFFTAVTRIVDREQMRAAVKGSVPAGTEELNLKAFDAGWSYFEAEYGEGKAEDAKTAATTT